MFFHWERTSSWIRTAETQSNAFLEYEWRSRNEKGHPCFVLIRKRLQNVSSKEWASLRQKRRINKWSEDWWSLNRKNENLNVKIQNKNGGKRKIKNEKLRETHHLTLESRTLRDCPGRHDRRHDTIFDWPCYFDRKSRDMVCDTSRPEDRQVKSRRPRAGRFRRWRRVKTTSHPLWKRVGTAMSQCSTFSGYAGCGNEGTLIN